MKKSLIKKIKYTYFIALACFAGFASSCGGGASSGGAAATGDQSAAGFTGANDIEAIVGSAWVIKWDTLNADNVIYAIYSGPDEKAIDLTTTIATTDESSYTYYPQNFYAEGKKCFLVKVSNMSGDTNEETQCTTEIPLGFTGVNNEISSTADGGWELQWQAVNVPGVMYQIYKGNKTAIDYEAPMGIETNSFFVIKKEDLPISRSDEICFVVRYFHDDLVPDANDIQVCTPTAPPIDFTGISQVRDLGSLKQIEVSWKKAPQENATDEAEETDELLQKVEVDHPDLTLVGDTYSFQTEILSASENSGVKVSVKAADKFGREDTNTCIAIVNINSGSTTVTEKPQNCDTDPDNDI
jgi:hypothetical protein